LVFYLADALALHSVLYLPTTYLLIIDLAAGWESIVLIAWLGRLDGWLDGWMGESNNDERTTDEMLYPISSAFFAHSRLFFSSSSCFILSFPVSFLVLLSCVERDITHHGTSQHRSSSTFGLFALEHIVVACIASHRIAFLGVFGWGKGGGGWVSFLSGFLTCFLLYLRQDSMAFFFHLHFFLLVFGMACCVFFLSAV